MPDSEIDVTPRRSALYLPGVNERALVKARALPVDVLIFDLEDAVAPSRKTEARTMVREQLDRGGYGSRECIVRVNGLDTEWCGPDLVALAGAPVHGVLFPKVCRASDMTRIGESMAAAGIDASMPVWIMAETPAGIVNIGDICQGDIAPVCVVAGTSDLSHELRVPPTPGRLGLFAALSACVIAARAVGADVLDGVHLDLDDERGLEKACVQGRNLGFDGKTLIHPRQLDLANRIFSPEAAALARARRVVEAWSEAEAAGSGVVVVDGRLVERLHVDEARRLLALARRIRDVDDAR